MKIYDFIKKSSSLVGVKDSESRYICISPAVCKLLGWPSNDLCVNKTDYDIPCSAARYAKEFIDSDQKVILFENQWVSIDIQRYVMDTIKILLTEKSLLFDGEEKKIYISCIDITGLPIMQHYVECLQYSKKNPDLNSVLGSYALNDFYCPLKLTEKQACCLFFLIRGKSYKEIASILNLSPRTIESHIELLKIRLNCQNKSQLIEYAIRVGYLFYIPPGLRGLASMK